jgi:hypothetical protein
MATDWSHRTKAIAYFEGMVHLDCGEPETAHYKAALDALRRSQDHTAIQAKLQEAINKLKALGEGESNG